MQRQLVASLDGLAQVKLDAAAFFDFLTHLAREDHGLIAALALGAIQGDIGAAHQFVGGDAARRGVRQAHRRCDADELRLDFVHVVEGAFDALDQALGLADVG